MTRPGARSGGSPARRSATTSISRVPKRRRARGHFAYFGKRAGPRRGYYTYRLAGWRIVVLNSGALEVTRQSRRLRNDCFPVSCARRSRQVRWLRRLMRRLTPNRCVIAYWHHPRYSSANPGPSPELRHVYQALYRGGAELALVGHSHSYERFAPMDGRGRRRRRGVREFVVGTGGASRAKPAAPARPRQPLLRPQPGLWSAQAEAPPAWLPLPLRTRGRRDARPRPVAAATAVRRGSGGPRRP